MTTINRAARAARRALLIEEARAYAGASGAVTKEQIKDMSRRYGYSVAYVAALMRMHDVPRAALDVPQHQVAPSTLEIIALIQEGAVSDADIARIYGLSRQRISQVRRRWTKAKAFANRTSAAKNILAVGQTVEALGDLGKSSAAIESHGSGR